MRAVLAVAVLAVGLVSAATAAPTDQSRRIASYCSTSGDLCYGIFEESGVIRYQLTLMAKYFGRYRVCVKPPAGATTCKSFPVKRTGQTFGGSVQWRKNFPNRGAGRYRVTWRHATGPMGPTLSFRR